MSCLCGGCADCMRAQGFDEEDDMPDEAGEQLRNGQMRLSTYIDLYARDESDRLDVLLIRDEAQKLEQRYDTLKKITHDFGEQ